MDNRVEFYVFTKEGKRGRARFQIYRIEFDSETDEVVSRKHWAGGTVRGWDSVNDANDAAAEMLNGEWNWGN